MHAKIREQITVYKPNQRHELGFFQTWIVMIQNMRNSRELIWQLFKRDFLAEYKKSFIGFSWVFFAPIFGIISWVFMQSTGLLNPGDVGIPYPAYVLIGSSMWGLFIGFYNSAAGTLSAGSDFIIQVNYPHEAMLFKQMAQQLANFSISFGLNILILLFYGIPLSWKMIFFPLVVLPLFFLGAAMGLIISMIAVVSYDVNKFVNSTIGLLFFITPVIYSNHVESPIVRLLIAWNPLTYLVCSARDVIIYGRLYDPTGFAICSGVSFLMFLISWRLFYVSENKLIERMV